MVAIPQGNSIIINCKCLIQCVFCLNRQPTVFDDYQSHHRFCYSVMKMSELEVFCACVENLEGGGGKNPFLFI